ncbi:helix-turn-helix domain-containing protein [Kibdelosporangium lantanae]|uniref:Helix-turn-helix domain-containing protein n=1 Tax=Kibdelosporangium lantanae TaxID=1497396 RepID=A0ABW3M8F4_9PSEU
MLPGGSRLSTPAAGEREVQENRARLIDVATEVFAERGLGVTSDEIAARAGLAAGTTYRTFPSKAVEQLIARAKADGYLRRTTNAATCSWST